MIVINGMPHNERELFELILVRKHCNDAPCYTMFYTCPLLRTNCNRDNFNFTSFKRFVLNHDYFTEEEMFERLL